MMMEINIRKILELIAFVLVTIYSTVSNNWAVWVVITLMLYIEGCIPSLKKWLDVRQTRYIDAMNKMQGASPDTSALVIPLQESIIRIEKRLDTLETISEDR
jgi:hypothetical protein